MRIFQKPLEFEWDDGNKNKNFMKHQVTDIECEEIFFDKDKKILRDVFHSRKEKRYIILGKTKLYRLLFMVFTIRNNKIRVISARDMNKKERKLL